MLYTIGCCKTSDHVTYSWMCSPSCCVPCQNATSVPSRSSSGACTLAHWNTWKIEFEQTYIQPIACQINCHLLNLSSASVFKVFQCHSKFVKMLSECQTAWIWLRRRVFGVSSGSKMFAYGTIVVSGGLRVIMSTSKEYHPGYHL